MVSGNHSSLRVVSNFIKVETNPCQAREWNKYERNPREGKKKFFLPFRHVNSTNVVNYHLRPQQRLLLSPLTWNNKMSGNRQTAHFGSVLATLPSTRQIPIVSDKIFLFQSELSDVCVPYRCVIYLSGPLCLCTGKKDLHIKITSFPFSGSSGSLVALSISVPLSLE